MDGVWIKDDLELTFIYARHKAVILSVLDSRNGASIIEIMKICPEYIRN